MLQLGPWKFAKEKRQTVFSALLRLAATRLSNLMKRGESWLVVYRQVQLLTCLLTVLGRGWGAGGTFLVLWAWASAHVRPHQCHLPLLPRWVNWPVTRLVTLHPTHFTPEAGRRPFQTVLLSSPCRLAVAQTWPPPAFPVGAAFNWVSSGSDLTLWSSFRALGGGGGVIMATRRKRASRWPGLVVWFHEG